jgi:hypothetical protein
VLQILQEMDRPEELPRAVALPKPVNFL